MTEGAVSTFGTNGEAGFGATGVGAAGLGLKAAVAPTLGEKVDGGVFGVNVDGMKGLETAADGAAGFGENTDGAGGAGGGGGGGLTCKDTQH